jgi:transposase
MYNAHRSKVLSLTYSLAGYSFLKKEKFSTQKYLVDITQFPGSPKLPGFVVTMDLTDEQWRLIEPILAVPVPDLPAPGRPPQEARAVLNGILWKLRTGAAWDDLPATYPSHQTCYRYYCEWNESGSFKAISAALYKDLLVRGGLDIKLALRRGDIRIIPVARKIKFEFAPRLQDTWQSSTVVIILQLALKKVLKEL